MATNATSLQTANPHRFTINESFVAAYREAHVEMLAAIEAMDEVTAQPAPNPLRVSHTRLRITRASFECRTIFRKVAGHLSRNATPTVAQAIAKLEQHHSDLFVLTSVHLANWTPQQVQADWAGYCYASDQVRARWRETIERELQLLYPLLDLRAGAQANARAFRSN